MKVIVAVFGLVLCASASLVDRSDYTGFQVIRAFPENNHHYNVLSRLRMSDEFDFWTDIADRNIDIMAAPESVSNLKNYLTLFGIDYDVHIENVQELVEINEAGKAKKGSRVDWTAYFSYDDLMTWMEEIAAAHSFANTISIGRSFENRDLKVMNINPGGSTRKIWIDAGIHAREWIAPATASYVINELTTNYASNQAIADAFDWYILVSNNPDGYDYSWTNSRMWRKTRKPNPGSSCIGTDPNRNFDFHWNEIGASNNPCSEIYAGEFGFSEPETAAVRDFITANNADGSFVLFLTIHSYGQYWLCPWGYTSDFPEDYPELTRVGMAGVNALTDVHGTQYTFGTSTNVLYAAAGGSDDWAKGVGGIAMSYTLELRDTGSWGFLLPASQILPTGQETWAGIQASALAV